MAEKSRVRSTKKQIDALITFIEVNPELSSNTKLGKNEMEKWEDLKNQLNSLDGPSRSVKEWKQVFGDLKTNARRRARLKKYDLNKTGGGPAEEKELTPMEQRLMQLISRVTVDGVPSIPEAGVDNMVIEVIDNKPDTDNVINAENIEDAGDGPTEDSTRSSRISASIIRKNKRKRPLSKEVNLQHLIASQVEIAKAINNLASAIRYMAKKCK